MAINNPPAAFSFKVQFGIDGIQNNNSVFQEASGLEAQIESVEYREGGENSLTYKLPGRVNYTNLRLKRGIISEPTILKWISDSYMSDFSKPIKPIDITISLLNEKHLPVVKWKISNAWPVKFESTPLNSQKNEIAIETLEFSYSTITRESV